MLESCTGPILICQQRPPYLNLMVHNYYRTLQVVNVVVGQNLPEGDDAGLAGQVFAVAVVTLGLASFALVLALTEQVLLEVVENNVKRGSDVYESGHVSYKIR